MQWRRVAFVSQIVPGVEDMKDLENKKLGILWIGNIPDHWKIESLGNVAQIILSNADKKSSSNESKIFLCNYTDVY